MSKSIPRPKNGVVVRDVYRRNRPPAVSVNKIVAAAAKRVAKVKNGDRSGGMLEKVSRDLSDTLSRVATEPTFVALCALIMVITISHAGDIDKGPLAPLFPATSTNAFVKWVRANVGKFFGALTFIPVAFTAPEKFRVLSIVLPTLFIYLVPALTSIEYSGLAALSFFFFNVKNKNTKVFITLILLGLWMFGVINAAPTDQGNPPNQPPAARRTRNVVEVDGEPEVTKEAYFENIGMDDILRQPAVKTKVPIKAASQTP